MYYDELPKLLDVMHPTGFDSWANYAGEMPEDEQLAVLSRNRDSDILTESNWHSAIAMFEAESAEYQIVTLAHWACGWIEYLTVNAGSSGATIGLDIVNALADYPILDEMDFCEREQQAADELWQNWYNPAERIAYIRANPEQFDFHSLGDILQCVRGKYFAGYASELIS